MSSYLEHLNILGKVDPSKSTATADEFRFKMKEAYSINDYDYEKLKKTVLDNKDSAINPTMEWVEMEKERNFKRVFQELWPNLSSKINPPEPTEAEKNLAALEHKKSLFNLIIQQDIDKLKETLKSTPPPPPPPALPLTNTCLTCLSNSKCTNCSNGFNITIGGLSTINPRIEITSKPSWTPTYSTSNLQNSFKNQIGNYPNTLSSYDFPYETSKYCEGIFKSMYNSPELENEVKLLKSIQESQEKLKINSKIEKTTDLVDDIIDKVKVLQTEMKRKSTALKIETELQNLNKQRELLRSASSLSINHLDYLDSNDLYKPDHHRHHIHTHTCRSRSRERLSSRSCSRERVRSCSRGKYPNSILKTTTTTIKESVSPARHHHHHKRASSSCSSKKNSFHSSLIDKYGKVRVQPKVDSWNLNCRHDSNIY